MLFHGLDVKMHRYGYMWIKTSKRGYVLVNHPKNYSANSVGLGQRIYNTHVAPDGTKPHVILGHTHQPQRGLSPDGTREIIATGCMRHPDGTRYSKQHITTHHAWGQSFVVMRDGYFTVYGRNSTDWESVLGENL